MAGLLGGIVGSAVAPAGAYELISTQVLSSTGSSITFSSIPQTYRHLQLRWLAKSSANNEDGLRLTFNNSSAAAYVDHFLRGDGATVNSSASATSQSFIRVLFSAAYFDAPSFGPAVMDILDYANTTKNTTTRSFQGYSWPGQRTQIILSSGAWLNTAAVTSLTLSPVVNEIALGSRFSLYGIKG